jgi:hypothetical protein
MSSWVAQSSDNILFDFWLAIRAPNCVVWEGSSLIHFSQLLLLLKLLPIPKLNCWNHKGYSSTPYLSLRIFKFHTLLKEIFPSSSGEIFQQCDRK